MSEVLKFVFKGSRNYVHGTSLFNALAYAAAQRGMTEGKLNVSFKQMIHNSLCILEEREPTTDDSVVAKITSNDGVIIALCINEAADVGITDRQEFDEPEVCRGAVLGEKSIVQENPHHQDRIELLVS